jgi:YVTN family beta-propeller protein
MSRILSLVVLLARGCSAAQAAPFAYVPNEKSGTVSVIDTASGAAVRQIAAGKRPRGSSPEGVNASRDGRWVAVAVEDTNSVALVDAAARTLVADIPVQGRNPEHAVFSPDGRWLLVSAENAEQVDVIDVAACRQVGSIAVGQLLWGVVIR